MAPSTLAVAAELVFVLAGVAVLLLLVFQLRLQQKFTTLDLDVQRLNKAHKEGALDARSRLEEASKALEELERQVGPRLEALEPDLADVGARMDEAWGRLEAVEGKLEQLAPLAAEMERRQGEAQEALDDAKSRLERAEEVARGAGDRLGEVDEALRDARNRLKRMEEAVDHLRSIHGEKFVEVGQHLEQIDARLAGMAERTADAPAPAPARKLRRPDPPDPVEEPVARPKPRPSPVASSEPKGWVLSSEERTTDWRKVVLLVLLAAAAIAVILALL